MDATAAAQTATPAGLRRAASAVAFAHGLRGDPLETTLLGRGPHVLDCVVERWVANRRPDAVGLAVRHGIGLNLARALVAAVEEMDAHAPEVEIARIWSAMPPEAAPVRPRPAAPQPTAPVAVAVAPLPIRVPAPLPALPSLPDLLADLDDGDDAAWFEENPERSHRLRPVMAGWVAVRLMALRAGLVPVALPVPGDRSTDAGEEDACAAYEDAALAWLAANRPCQAPDRDRVWFAERPGRRHRLRTPLLSESEGRMPAAWTTLVCLHLGRVLFICLDEASIPPGDRREDHLRSVFRAKAAALATALTLGVFSDVEEPAHESSPLRTAPPRLLAEAPLLALPAPVRPAPEADGDAEGHGLPVAFDEDGNLPDIAGRMGRKQINGGGGFAGLYESWEERSTARAQSLVWPCMRIDEAFDVVGELLDRNGGLPIRAHDVRTQSKRFCEDGTAAIATLKAYGLIEAGANGMVRLTDVARDGLGRERKAKGAALARVATGPAAYRTLMESVGPAPTIEALKGLPLAKDMSKPDLAKLHERYTSAMAFHRAAGAFEDAGTR